MRPTAGCLFSGMGGLARGLEAAGFTLSWANDADRQAADAFRHRFPEVPYHQGDVRQLQAQSLTPVDILAGGFPCQSFSQAGDRRGFEDERGALFSEIPRLIGEWPAALRPKLLLLENVPYLLSGADGAWFQRIRRELRRAGYWFREESCWIADLRRETGLPQQRERLFLVAASRAHFDYNPFTPPPHYNGVTEATIHDIVDRSSRADDVDYLSEGNRYREMIEAAAAQGESRDNIYQLRRNYVREKPRGLCPTLTANMGGGGHNVPFVFDKWGLRRLRVREVARLQGFDEDESKLFPETISTPHRYRLIGNAACPGLAQRAAERCLDALKENA